MRILHFGDIHLWQLGLDPDFYYPKRILGLVNLALRRRHKFPAELAARAAEAIVQEEADIVVFSGDMSTMSRESEFAAAARLFEPMFEKWGDRFFVIPGNHDRYTPMSVRKRGYERHFPYAQFEGGRRVRSLEIDGVRLVGIDASRPYWVRSNGLFDEALRRELGAELATAGDLATILVGHFPFAYPGGVEGKWDHKLLGDGQLARVVAEHKPAVYLHGHKHQRWVLRDARAPETLCINCGPAGMGSSDPDKHSGWVRFELDSEGVVSQLESAVLNQSGIARDTMRVPPQA